MKNRKPAERGLPALKKSIDGDRVGTVSDRRHVALDAVFLHRSTNSQRISGSSSSYSIKVPPSRELVVGPSRLLRVLASWMVVGFLRLPRRSAICLAGSELVLRGVWNQPSGGL